MVHPVTTELSCMHDTSGVEEGKDDEDAIMRKNEQ